MTDPFQTIAAVAGVADVVFRTTLKLYTFFSDLRGVPREIQELTESLRLWNSISQHIRDVSTQYQTSSFATEDGLTFDILHEALKACESVCQTIEAFVQKHESSRDAARIKRFEEVKWLFSIDKVRTAQQALEKSKLSLNSALSVIGRQNDIILRSQIGGVREQVSQWGRDLLDGIGSLDRNINDQFSDLRQSNSQISVALDGNTSKIVGVVQTSHSTITTTQSSIRASQDCLHRRLDNLNKDVTRSRVSTARQISTEHRRMQRRLASVEAKIAQLAITHDQATGKHDIFAGQNLQEILWPLMMMHSELLPFILELVNRKQIQVNDEDIEDIHSQFEDLFASCQEASAAELRRKRKSRIRRPAGSTMDSQFERQSQGEPTTLRCKLGTRDLEYQEKHAKLYHRSGTWSKRLPHGLLKVQMAPIQDGNSQKNADGVYAVFTFMPDPGMNAKCLSTMFQSGTRAALSPMEYYHFYLFNWIGALDNVMRVILDDDVSELQRRLARGEVTPRDRCINWESSVLGLAATCKSPKCFQLLLEQGAPVQDAGWRGASVLVSVYQMLTGIRWQEFEDVRFILDSALTHGADFDDWPNPSEYRSRYPCLFATPLHEIAAGWTHNYPVIERELSYLIKKGFDINTRDAKGCTPFLLMVREKSLMLTPGLCQVWLDVGAEVKAEDRSGCNSLHLFAMNGWFLPGPPPREFEDTLRWLLKVGCDPNHTDILGRTPSVYWRHGSGTNHHEWGVWVSALNEMQMADSVDLEDEFDGVPCPWPYPNTCPTCCPDAHSMTMADLKFTRGDGFEFCDSQAEESNDSILDERAIEEIEESASETEESEDGGVALS